MFSDLMTMFSSKVEDHDDWNDVTVEAITKAEERVRLAQEKMVNNSLARERLALIKIIRYTYVLAIQSIPNKY